MQAKRLFPFLRFLALTLAAVLLCALPFAVLTAAYLTAEPQYGKTYYAALPLKYERLIRTPGSRVVVIGGSSAAFGIDSKIMEKELGMPCVNFGLYAAFGLKCMLDLSIQGIHAGDIVVIAPEYSSQMYSDYIGSSYLLQALESAPEIFLAFDNKYVAGLLEAMSSHLEEKRGFAENGSPDPQGVYAYSAFDSYGDIIYDRPENMMDSMVSADNLPQIDPTIVTDDFADMINEYVAAVEKKGAQVYFGFCPVNRLSVELAEDTDTEGFLTALQQKLHCPVLSSLEDHMMDPGYFYDSNYHMNNAGAVFNTVLLVNDIKRIRGEMSPTLTKIPDPVAGSTSDVLSSGSIDGLRYDITAEGAVITGLDKEGLQMQTINVPETIDGASVYKIASSAFSGCAASQIEIPKTVRVLSGKLFCDAKNLSAVHLLSDTLPQVGDSMMTGAAENVKIYVPADIYGDYITDYFWALYAEYLEKID